MDETQLSVTTNKINDLIPLKLHQIENVCVDSRRNIFIIISIDCFHSKPNYALHTKASNCHDITGRMLEIKFLRRRIKKSV